MEKEAVIKTIAKKICEDILKQPERELSPDEALISSGIIDSFSLVDLALIVEEKFAVRIEDYELNVDTFDNLNQLADIVIQRGA